MLRTSFLGLTLLAACLVAAGFLGQLHRGTDSISILRPVFGFACIFGVILTRSIWLRLIFGGTALLAVYTVGVHFLPQESGGDIRIYSKNLGYRNTEMQGIVADIEAADGDVVMLQEVTLQNDYILRSLQMSFPYQHLCRFSGRIGIALVSRHPFVDDPVCSDWRAVLAAPILLDGQHLWVVSAHIPWPWPHDSVENEMASTKVLSVLEGPIVIAGDFNMVPWAGRVGRIASMTDTQLAGPVRPTLYFRNFPLPIDLVMAPGGGSMETRPLLGSDHLGIVADLLVWSR
jgi:endonuclease/exonuclease/phosphatase (EEP) superfamily protein YafD